MLAAPSLNLQVRPECWASLFLISAKISANLYGTWSQMPLRASHVPTTRNSLRLATIVLLFGDQTNSAAFLLN